MEEIETLKTMLGKIAEEEKKTITENRRRKVSYSIAIIIIGFFTVISSLSQLSSLNFFVSTV